MTLVPVKLKPPPVLPPPELPGVPGVPPGTVDVTLGSTVDDVVVLVSVDGGDVEVVMAEGVKVVVVTEGGEAVVDVDVRKVVDVLVDVEVLVDVAGIVVGGSGRARGAVAAMN